MLQFFIDKPPNANDWYLPLLAPGGLAILGVLLFYWAERMRSFGEPKLLAGVGASLLALASFGLGLLESSRLSDFVYRALVESSKVEAALILAPLPGLCASLGFAAWTLHRKARARRHDYLDDLAPKDP